MPDHSSKTTPAGFVTDAALCCILDEAGRVLAVSRPGEPRNLGFPGGMVEPGECALEAAVRELREETGVVLDGDCLYECISHQSIDTPHRLVHVFCTGSWGSAHAARHMAITAPLSAEPDTYVGWVEPEELLAPACSFAGFLRKPSGFAGGGTIFECIFGRKPRAHAVAAADKGGAAEADHETGSRVYMQLAEDFPVKLLGWVRAAHWVGPVQVPIDSIDTSSRDAWKATHDGVEILEGHVERIQRKGADSKPVVLVKEPNNPKLIIVDGHHRILAYEALGEPALAFVARVGTVKGPWDELHAAQKGGPSRATNVSVPSEALMGAIADSSASWCLSDVAPLESKALLDMSISDVHVPSATSAIKPMAYVAREMADAPPPPLGGNGGGPSPAPPFVKPGSVKDKAKRRMRRRGALKKGLRVTADHPRHGRFEIRYMRDNAGAPSCAYAFDAHDSAAPRILLDQRLDLPPDAQGADDEHGGQAALVWVNIAVPGHFEGHRAGPFDLDDKVFAQIMRNYRDIDGGKVAFDYEHASEMDASDGSIPQLGAPAQGWIKDLKVENRRLYALVEWLEPARTQIRQKKYQYVSPAIRFGAKHPRTGEAIGARLTSVALTNQPFLRGLEALQAKDRGAPDMPNAAPSSDSRFAHTPDEYMPKLRAAFGLGALAAPEDVAEELELLREHMTAAHGDATKTVNGVRLADYVVPLRELAFGAAMGHTVDEVLDSAAAMLTQAMGHTNLAGGEAPLPSTETTHLTDTENTMSAEEKQAVALLTAAQAKLETTEQVVKAKDAELGAKAKTVTELEQKVAARDTALTAKDTELATKDAEILRLNGELKAHADAADAKLLKDAHETYGDKKQLSKEAMGAMLKADRPLFEKEFPVVAATQRHLQTNLTDRPSGGAAPALVEGGTGEALPSTNELAKKLMKDAADKGGALAFLDAQNQAHVMRRNAGLKG